MKASQAFRWFTAPSRLRSIYEESVATRRAAGRDGLRPRDLSHHLDSELHLISRRLRSGTYRFTAYKELLKSKGAGKYPRVLSIPTARDRIAIKAVASTLASAFGVETSELASWKISRLKAALVEERFDAFVRIDVQDFYPSIDHDILVRALRTKTRTPELLRVVRDAVTTPTIPSGERRGSRLNARGVPQGLSVSNVLAEIYMRMFDLHFERSEEIAYFRYVDDILVLCKSAAQPAVDAELRNRLAEMRLSAHPVGEDSKSQLGLLSEGFAYLGFQFSDSGVSVRPGSVRTLEDSLVRHFVRYRRALSERPEGYLQTEWERRQLAYLEWMLNISITGCVIDGTRWGWLHYFSAGDDYGLMARLDHFVRRLALRFGVDKGVAVKSFRSAYWSLKFPGPRRQGYIPNFDEMSAEGLRDPLSNVFWLPETLLASMEWDVLHALLLSKMRRTLERLERDVGHLS